MALGFVLVSAEPAHEHDVYNRLDKKKEKTKGKKKARITEIHPLFGEYDFIVKIMGRNFEELGNFVANDIRSIKGILDTKTLTGTKF